MERTYTSTAGERFGHAARGRLAMSALADLRTRGRRTHPPSRAEFKLPTFARRTERGRGLAPPPFRSLKWVTRRRVAVSQGSARRRTGHAARPRTTDSRQKRATRP